MVLVALVDHEVLIVLVMVVGMVVVVVMVVMVAQGFHYQYDSITLPMVYGELCNKGAELGDLDKNTLSICRAVSCIHS